MMDFHNSQLILLSLFIGGSHAGSCYYVKYYTYGSYTVYDACLTGCCGSKYPGGQNYCCSQTGAVVGIILAIVVVIAVIVTFCIIRRRRRRQAAYRLNRETDRIITSEQVPAGAYNPGAPGPVAGQYYPQTHGPGPAAGQYYQQPHGPAPDGGQTYPQPPTYTSQYPNHPQSNDNHGPINYKQS